MHLSYRLLDFVTSFHCVLGDGESICFLEIQYHFTSVFFEPNSAESRKLTFASFTFSFCFVVLSPITKRFRMVCTSSTSLHLNSSKVIFRSLLCILNPFTTSLLMLSPLNCCSRCFTALWLLPSIDILFHDCY